MLAKVNIYWRKQSLSFKLSVLFLVGIIIIALIGPVICGLGGIIGFNPNDLSPSDLDFAIPGTRELDGRIHFLGTDRLGRDIAARLIFGTRTAMIIGSFTVCISAIIALVLAILSGYYGNDRIKMNVLQFVWIILFIPIILFYYNEYSLGMINFLGFIILLLVLKWLSYLPHKKYSIPFDLIIVKCIEIFKTIPALFLILSLFAIINKPSVWTVAIILGLVSWPGKTRLLRAEILKEKESNYVKSAEALGLSERVVIFKHLLPNVISPLLVAATFTFTGAIVAESTLSFLNVGLPDEIPSWGGILRQARDYYPAWWLAVFPGMALFLTVLSLNIVADRINH